MPVYACPRCDAPSSPEHCPACGRGPEPLLVDLAALDADLRSRREEEATARRRLDVLRSEITGIERNRSSVLRRLAERAASLRGGAGSPAPAPPVAPPTAPPMAPMPPPMPPGVPHPMTSHAPSASPPPMPVMAPSVHGPVHAPPPSGFPGPVPPEQSTRSVQTILLTLGGILFGAAAIIFTAVAWATFGLAGRATILSVITLVALAAPFVLMRRSMTATAETIATVGLVLTFCDAIAVYYLDLLPGASGRSDQPGIMALLILVTLVALGYRSLSGLVAPAFAVPALALPAAVVAGIQESRAVGVVGLLVVAAVLAGSSILFGRFPGRTPERVRPIVVAVPGGGAVVVVAVAAILAGQAIDLGPTALAAVAVAALLTTNRPAPPWRLGPVVGAWTVAGFTLATTGVACLGLAIVGVSRIDAFAWPHAWQYPLALAAVGVAASFASRRAIARGLRFAAPGVAVAALPAALDLPWRAGAGGVAVVAAIAAIASVVVPRTAGDDRRSRDVLWTRGVALGLAVHASLTATGDPTVFAIVAGGLAAVAAVLAVLTRGDRAAGPFAATAVVLAALAQPSALFAMSVAGDDAALIMCSTVAIGAAAVAIRVAVTAAAATTDWNLVRWLSWSVAAAGVVTASTAGSMLVEAATPGRALLAPTTLMLAGFALVVLAVAPNATSNRIAVAATAVAVVDVVATLIAVNVGGEDLLVHTGLTALLATYLGVHKSLNEVLRRGLVWAGLAVGGVCAAVAAVGAAEAWAVSAGIGEVSLATWRTPVVLLLVAAALAILPSWRPRFDGAAWSVVAALGSVPAVWFPDAWWAPSTVAAASGAVMITGAAFAPGRAIAASRVAVGLLVHVYGAACAVTADTVAQRFGTAAAVAAATLAAGVALAVTARARDRLFGAIGVSIAVAAAPVTALFAALAAEWPRELVTPAALGAAAAGLLAAGILRMRGSDYLRFATATVPIAATGAALTGLPLPESGVYTAVSGLIGVGAAMLVLDDRRRALVRTGLSSIPIAITALLAAPLAADAILRPYSWLGAVGHRTPTATVDGLAPVTPPISGTAWDTVGLTVAGLAAVLAAVGLSRRWLYPVAVTALAAVVPTIPVVADAPWPTLPVVATLIGVTGHLVVSCRVLDGGRAILTGFVAVAVGGSGLAGSLADTRVAAVLLTVAGVAGVVAALAGATITARVVAWPIVAAALTGAAAAIGDTVGLPASDTAFAVLGVAVALLVVAASRSPILRGAGRSAEASGWATGVVAAAVAGAVMPHTSIVLVALAAAAGLAAVRTGAERTLLLPARPYAWTAAALTVIAYWLLLSDHSVSMVELYTIPFAAVTAVVGWWEFRRRPAMRSWTAYGPALVIALLPTLAVAMADGDPARRIGLGAMALAVLLAGVARRLQAPVLAGSVTLILLALWEIVQVWRSVPFWAPLAVAGILLLVVGATFEKRRRDVRRLAQRLGSMR